MKKAIFVVVIAILFPLAAEAEMIHGFSMGIGGSVSKMQKLPSSGTVGVVMPKYVSLNNEVLKLQKGKKETYFDARTGRTSTIRYNGIVAESIVFEINENIIYLPLQGSIELFGREYKITAEDDHIMLSKIK